MKNKCSAYSTYDAGRATLLIPKAVEEFAQAFADKGWKAYDNRTMCKWIDPINWNEGIILERTFAIHRMKNGTADITECARRLPDQPTVISNAYWYGLGGWVYERGGQWDKTNFWYAYKKNNCRFYGKVLNEEEIISNYMPYCCWDKVKESQLNISFYEFLEIYIRNPKAVEMLIKNGYSELLTSTRYLNFKAKNIAECLKVNNKWVKFLKGKSQYFLFACRKPYVKTEEDAELVADILYYKPAAGLLKYAPGREIQMCHFLQRADFVLNHDNIALYKDYLKFANQIGMPMDRKEVLFPVDWRRAHDDASEQIEVILSKAKDMEIKKYHDKAMKYAFEKDGLLIKPVESGAEMVLESKILKHCVRTYVDKVANGKTMIFFIRKSEDPATPYVTLELADKHIVQYHGYRNDVEFPIAPEVQNFIKEWKSKYKFA